MDIETFIKDGVHIPYCICFYDGKLIYKVKGLIHSIELTMDDFENLLIIFLILIICS